MLEKLKETFATAANAAAKLQALYRERRREYARLTEEIQSIRQAPPARSDLEQRLHQIIDCYCDRHAEKLLAGLQGFQNNSDQSDPEAPARMIQIFASGFVNYPVDYGVMALYREALHQGATHFAATCPWPDTAIDQATKEQRISELEPKQQALADEMGVLWEAAEKAGIKL